MRNIISVIAIVLIATVTAGLVVYYSVCEKSFEALSEAEASLVISEVMSGNKGVYIDDQGKSSDWVELYNPSDEAVSMARFSLSDNEANLDKWTFPDVTLQPHNYIVVFLSGKSKKDTDDGLHASFKLKAEGEDLILSAGGQIVDSVELPAMPDNISYVRVGEAWRLAENPTPGIANGQHG
jgi:hypothetical protein